MSEAHDTEVCIYDFEYGMQECMGNIINVPYFSGSWTKGGPKCTYNIILLSKPFDCLTRQLADIPNHSKTSFLKNEHKDMWHSLNGSDAFYTQINNYIDTINNKFIIHPRNLLFDYNVILPRLQSFLNLPDVTIQFNPDDYWSWYQKNANIG